MCQGAPIRKLYDMGIYGYTLAGMNAFISDHRETVRVAGLFNPFVPVTSGVTQGSVSALLFFLIYANFVVYEQKLHYKFFCRCPEGVPI